MVRAARARAGTRCGGGVRRGAGARTVRVIPSPRPALLGRVGGRVHRALPRAWRPSAGTADRRGVRADQAGRGTGPALPVVRRRASAGVGSV